MFEYGQFKHSQREKPLSMSDGCYAWCHARWRGLESHLFSCYVKPIEEFHSFLLSVSLQTTP